MYTVAQKLGYQFESVWKIFYWTESIKSGYWINILTELKELKEIISFSYVRIEHCPLKLFCMIVLIMYVVSTIFFFFF